MGRCRFPFKCSVVEATDKIYKKFGTGSVNQHMSRDFSFGLTSFNIGVPCYSRWVYTYERSFGRWGI